jgi:hypothetical protein
LVLVGLTLGLAGEAADQSAHAQPPEIAASASIDSSAALSAEGRHVPVLLAAADTQKGESDANEAGPAGKPGETADMKSRSTAEQKILNALDEPTVLEFLDTPLSDVVDTLEDHHEIQILIDQRALDDVGVPSHSPITSQLSGVSLQSGLNLMLRELDLTWTIRDEVLLITTPEEAEMMLVTKVYDVGDLVTCQDKSGELWVDYDSLIEVITTTIGPETWEDVGGPGSIAPAPFRGADMLVVRQTYQIHQEIEQLLDQVRQIAEENGSGEPPIREKPEGGSMHGRTGRGGLGFGMGGGMGIGMAGPGPLQQPADQAKTGVPGEPSTSAPEGLPAGAAPPAGAAGTETDARGENG